MRKAAAVLLAILMLLQLSSISAFADVGQTKEALDYIEVEGSYSQYKNQHKNAKKPDYDKIFPAENAEASEGAETSIATYEGEDYKVLEWTNGSGSVTWTVDVPETGLYNFKIKHIGGNGRFVDSERGVKIDGEYPFEEVRVIAFTKVCKNKYDEIKVDNQGNQLRPSQVEVGVWQEVWIADHTGTFGDPFDIYLTAGTHTFELVGVSEGMNIEYIRITQKEAVATYEEYLDANKNKPAEEVSEIVIQAEDSVLRSSPMLYPQYNINNANNEPLNIELTEFNVVGGYNWRNNGQWLEWNFKAEKSGWYKMAFRYTQDWLMGIPSTRRIEIDGKVPFEEMDTVEFNYSTRWQVQEVSDKNGKALLIYLEAGDHTLRMTNHLGDTAVALYNVQQITRELLDVYSQIIMVTSASPDLYRDYQLTIRIPDLLDRLKENADALYDLAAYVRSMSEDRASEAHSIERVADQINEMVKDEYSIPNKLSYFNASLSSLSSSVLSMSEQSLLLDYIQLIPENAPTPKANAGFFKSLKMTLKKFIVSFFKDYTAVGNMYEGGEKLDVWVLLGQEQANTIKSIIDDSFSAEKGINVNMNIVSNGAVVLYSVAADKAPNVAINTGGGLPVDYGIRGALEDLKQFSDYDEIVQRFMPSAMVSFEYLGKVYGLPMTQSFPVMFYRTDIFEELGLEVPETWEDVYKVVYKLQENNLAFGGISFDTLLFQNGGTYYSEGRDKCVLDSAIGLEAFDEWCKLYTHYGIPIEYNFLTRFRMGEMPIAIVDYLTYNSLVVASPEIKGLWDIALVPGTVDENGNINRAVAGACSSVVIFKNKDQNMVDKSWEFLKWFTSAEIQTRYGMETEAILGAGARYGSANIEAVENFAWESRVINIIKEQWEDVLCVPNIPGSYIVGRNVDNAFREVYELGEVPRVAMIKYVNIINEEITRKRKEFNIE